MKIVCIFAALGLLVSAWADKPKSIFSKIMSVLSCILDIALVIPILIYGDLDGAMWQVILLSSGLFVLFIPFLIFIIGFKYDKKIEEKERLKQAAIKAENKRKEEEAKKRKRKKSKNAFKQKKIDLSIFIRNVNEEIFAALKPKPKSKDLCLSQKSIISQTMKKLCLFFSKGKTS